MSRTVVIRESGMAFELPEEAFFRFEGCSAYDAIKSESVTEMDIGWLDRKGEALWLVEAKRLYDRSNPLYQEKDMASGSVAEELATAFVRNAWHSLSMLAQNRSGTRACAESVEGFDFERPALKLLFLIDLPPEKEHYLLALQQRVKARLRDARAVFRVETVAVLPYNRAKTFAGLREWVR